MCRACGVEWIGCIKEVPDGGSIVVDILCLSRHDSALGSENTGRTCQLRFQAAVLDAPALPRSRPFDKETDSSLVVPATRALLNLGFGCIYEEREHDGWGYGLPSLTPEGELVGYDGSGLTCELEPMDGFSIDPLAGYTASALEPVMTRSLFVGVGDLSVQQGMPVRVEMQVFNGEPMSNNMTGACTLGTLSGDVRTAQDIKNAAEELASRAGFLPDPRYAWETVDSGFVRRIGERFFVTQFIGPEVKKLTKGIGHLP